MPAEILQGTLDMLILKAVVLGPLQGYGVLLRIQQISRDLLQLPQGSLYPARTACSIADSSNPNGQRA